MFFRSFPLFFALKLRQKSPQRSLATEKMIRFSVAGIALCVTVMLLTIFIGWGFREEVTKRLNLITGDIKLSPSQSLEGERSRLRFTPQMRETLLSQPAIREVRPVVEAPALLKTDSAFRGVVALGYEEEDLQHLYQTLAIEQHQKAPSSRPSTGVVLSLNLAEELHLTIGDKVPLYTLGQPLSLRMVTVEGISDIPEIGSGILTMPMGRLKQMGGFEDNEVSYLEIFLEEGEKQEIVADNLVESLSNENFLGGQRLGINTARELMPSLYDWIDMLDGNTILLLIIMAVVAGFTAITGILIVILSRTRMIGVLKALGSSDSSIRRIFLYLGVNIVLRGLCWGNILAFLLSEVQRAFKLVSLNPSTYYISYVPIRYSFSMWFLVNIGAIAAIMLMIYFSTRVISRIKPSESLRFS